MGKKSRCINRKKMKQKKKVKMQSKKVKEKCIIVKKNKKSIFTRNILYKKRETLQKNVRSDTKKKNK